MLLWITGQSGAGKTTLGNNLKQHGLTHYDGDTFANGGDPISQTGIPDEHMLAKRDPKLKQIYETLTVEAFGAMFKGQEVPIEKWTPFIDIMIADIRRVYKDNMAVTWSVYPYEVRQYIRTNLPEVEFVVLNVKDGSNVKRKVQQTVDAAQAAGKSLPEYLAPFGIKNEDATVDQLNKRISSIQVGFEGARSDEFGIDLDAQVSSQDVLNRVVSKFNLHPK